MLLFFVYFQFVDFQYSNKMRITLLLNNYTLFIIVYLISLSAASTNKVFVMNTEDYGHLNTIDQNIPDTITNIAVTTDNTFVIAGKYNYSEAHLCSVH